MTDTTTPHRAEPPDGAGRVEFTITGVDRAALRRGVADALRLYDPAAEGWTVVMRITGETPDATWPTRTLVPETWSADVSARATPPPQGYTGAPLVLEDDHRVWPVVGRPARHPDAEVVYIETGCRACPEGHRPHDRWLVVADEWTETRDGLPTRIVVYPWNDAHVAPADVDVVRAALTDLRPGATERDTTPATGQFHPADPYAPGHIRPPLNAVERPNPSRATEPAPVERSPFWRRWRWR